jgi:MOB kinase activator 1
VDFFNEISLLYGTITEFCTEQNCPTMCAGDQFQYLWADGVKVKTPTSVPAPDYVDLLIAWVESQLNDDQIFPLQFGNPFPKNFLQIVKTIFKRLFRIYAHMYYSHYENIQILGVDAHMNTCFKQFILFVREFDLVEDKETAVLDSVISKLLSKEELPKSGGIKSLFNTPIHEEEETKTPQND